MRFLARALGISLFLFVTYGQMACRRNHKKDEEIPTAQQVPGNQDTYQAVKWDQTQEIPPDSDLVISYDADRGILVLRNTALSQSFQLEDVVLVPVTPKTPNGLIVWIEEKQEVEGNLVFKVKIAPLQAAFRSIAVKAKRSIDDLSALQPQKSFLDGASGSLSFDWFAFNGDGDPKTKDDQVRVQGSLSGSLEFDFTLDFDWDVVKVRPKPPFIDTELPELKVGLAATAKSKAVLDMEGAAAKTFKREDVIWSTPLSPIPIGLLVFVPVVDLVSEVYGGASSSLHVKMGGSFETGVEVGYSTKSGGTADIKSPSLSSEPIVADVRGRAEAGVSIGPRLHLRLYGAAGPYADLAAQAQVKADIDATPCWQANAGLGGHVGIDIVAPIYGYDVKIANWNKEISLAKVDLASGTCVGADGSDPAAAAKAETPLFASFAYWMKDIWTNAPRFTTASFGPDGNFLLTGSTAKVLAKLPGKNADRPLWVRQFHYEGEYQDRYPYYQNSVYLAHGVKHVVSTLNPFGMIAVNNEGLADWARVISGSFGNDPEFQQRLMHAAGDGSIYLSGELEPESAKADLWISRWLDTGKLLWQKKFHVFGGKEKVMGAIANDSGVLILGQSALSDPSPSWKSWMMLLDMDGNPKWVRGLGGCGSDEVLVSDGVKTVDGDYLITGALAYRSFGARALMMRIKPDGTLAMSGSFKAKAEGQSVGLDASALRQLPTGNLLIAGRSFALSDIYEQHWLARTDSVGNPDWAFMYRPAGSKSIERSGGPDLFPSLDDNGVLVSTTSSVLSKEGESSGSLIMKLPFKTGNFDWDPALGGDRLKLSTEYQSSTCLSLSTETASFAEANLKIVETGAKAVDIEREIQRVSAGSH